MIKKCPFCGCEAVMAVSYGRHGDFGYVKCTMCSARSGTKKLTRDYTVKEWDNGKVFDDPAFKSIVLKWNTRCDEDSEDAEQDY